MINRRQLIQRGTSAVMALTLFSSTPGTFASQSGSSSPIAIRSPLGQETWSLAYDSPIFVTYHGGVREGSTASNQCLVISETSMANLDLDDLTVLWESATPFSVESTGRAAYLDSRPGSLYCVLSGAGRAAIVEATTGNVVLDIPVSEGDSYLSIPTTGKPYLWDLDPVNGGGRLQGFDLETNDVAWSLDHVQDRWSHDGGMITLTTDTVALHDLETGEPVWSTNVPGVDDLRILDGMQLAMSPDEITAINGETGDMLWIAHLPDRYETVSHGDDGLLVTMQSRLVLLDLQSGLEAWSTSFDSTPSILDSMDQSVLITEGWTLKLIDTETGTVKWQTAYDDDLNVSYSAESRWRIRAGNTLAILASDDARILWETDDWSRARWSDEHLVLLRSSSEIDCISVVTGRRLWTIPFDLWGEIELAISGGVVGITVDGGPCTVLDLETGDEVRTIGVSSQTGMITMTSGYVTYAGERTVNVTHLATGTFLGALVFNDPSTLEISSRYIKTDRSIILLDEDGMRVSTAIRVESDARLWRADSSEWVVRDASSLFHCDETGAETWRIPIDAWISDVVFLNDTGALLVLFESHSWIVDRTEGRVLWEFQAAPGAGYLQHVALVRDRLLFITDRRASMFQAPQTTIVSRDIALRGAPNENAVERGQLRAGTVVVPTGNAREANGADWWEVRVDEITGWVPGDALSVTSATPSATPLASPDASPAATPSGKVTSGT